MTVGIDISFSGQPGGGGGGAVVSRTVVLSNAQILALPTTPVEIIPAPGSGKLILPQMVYLRLNWLADYSNISVDGNLRFVSTNFDAFIGGLDETVDGIKVSQLLAAGAVADAVLYNISIASASFNFGGIAGSWENGEALPVDANYVIRCANFLGAYTGGDPSNTLQVTVLYTVISIS